MAHVDMDHDHDYERERERERESVLRQNKDLLMVVCCVCRVQFKEGGLIDEHFSLMSLIAVFTRTNAFAEQTGDDEDGGMSELNFTEFIDLLARVAHAKFMSMIVNAPADAPANAPAASIAQGSPEPTAEVTEDFEETWRSFLGLIFVPRFKKLLKAKRQGQGRVTLDGKSF